MITMQNYEQQLSVYRQTAQQAVQDAANRYLPESSSVCRAARYSLLNGGKRVRAVLVLAACALVDGDGSAAAHFAAAVEMLHCYSLIHDDLPCMDDDDYRRGRLSCHKAFDEATAMLAGDVLLTEAFAAVCGAGAPAQMQSAAAAALAEGAGSCGMVLGQELDLAAEKTVPDEAALYRVHHYKTGSLIAAAVRMGAVCGAPAAAELETLTQYAFDLGLVFQIVDDVLDVTSTSAELGKPVGSDAANGKVTFATLYGPDGAMQKAAACNAQNCARMQAVFGEKAAFLTAFAQDLLRRKN